MRRASDFHTDGSFSLQIDSAGLQERGWYGKQFDPPIQVRGKHALTVDIKTMETGTQTAIAVQVDDDWTWCATPTPDWGQAEPGESLQVTLEFETMTTNDDSTRAAATSCPLRPRPR